MTDAMKSLLVTPEDLVVEIALRGVRDGAGIALIAAELGLPNPESYKDVPAWLQAELDKMDNTSASMKEIKLTLTEIMRNTKVPAQHRTAAAAKLAELKLKTEGEEAVSAELAAQQIKTMLGLV